MINQTRLLCFSIDLKTWNSETLADILREALRSKLNHINHNQPRKNLQMQGVAIAEFTFKTPNQRPTNWDLLSRSFWSPLDNLQSNLHEAAEQIQSRGFDSRPEEDTS